jgi:hypothetical protein
MSRLQELGGRLGRLDPRRDRSSEQPTATNAVPAAPPPGGAAESEENTDLLAQRDRLLEKFTIMQADLGGAFYEMAIRDHVRMDVLTRKAAELQRVDAELLTLERMLELQRSDSAGNCPSCGAPFGHADRFCGHCGRPLVVTEVPV